MEESVFDVVIVGGGVAGCALAYALAKQQQQQQQQQQGQERRRIAMIERDLSEPNRIVGELLQPLGCKILGELGLGDALNDMDATTNVGYSIHMDKEDACDVDYLSPTHPGKSFHHGRFVQNLRKAVLAIPNITVIESSVTDFIINGDVVIGVHTKTKGDVFGKFTVACDGCWSNHRKVLAQEECIQIQNPSNFVGLIIDYNAIPSPARGNVILTDSAIVLVYGISSTEARVLVDIQDKTISLEQMPSFLINTVCPNLPKKMQQSFVDAVNVPNSLRTRQNLVMTAPRLKKTVRGAMLMGDALNMRHPLTGGGMTVAISDAQLLAQQLEHVDDFASPVAMEKAVEAFLYYRKDRVAAINILAMALYRVFEHSDAPHRIAMRQGCFKYLKKGGWFSRGPVGFLSGMISDSNFLALHFFAVACYCVGRTIMGEGPPVIREAPFPKRLWIAAQLMTDASFNILPEIGKENVSILAPLGRLLNFI